MFIFMCNPFSLEGLKHPSNLTEHKEDDNLSHINTPWYIWRLFNGMVSLKAIKWADMSFYIFYDILGIVMKDLMPLKDEGLTGLGPLIELLELFKGFLGKGYVVIH